MPGMLSMTKGFLPKHRWICWWMLFSRRQYVIDKIKRPLVNAITILASRYPEPTKDHTSLARTHILLDIQDKFFKHEDNPSRDALFRALWRMFIVEYEHDPYYRYRIDWVIEELRKSNWEDSPTAHETSCWKETNEEEQ